MVGSDWGAALAMDWAYPNPQRMKGLVYFEAIVLNNTTMKPLQIGEILFGTSKGLRVKS